MSGPMNGKDVREEVTAEAQGGSETLIGNPEGKPHPGEPARRPAPLFEIIIPASIAVLNGRNLHHFKIWPDGHVEGFEALGGQGAIVHSRLPDLLMSIAEPIYQVANTMNAVIHALAKGSMVQTESDEEAKKRESRLVVPGG